MPEIHENTINWLKSCHNDSPDGRSAIYQVLYNNKLNIVLLVKNMYNVGLKEAKDWCDNNIFNN